MTDLRLAAFVHVPLIARGGTRAAKGMPRITLEELVDAGEAMLMEMVRLARQGVALAASRRTPRPITSCSPKPNRPCRHEGATCPLETGRR